MLRYFSVPCGMWRTAVSLVSRSRKKTTQHEKFWEIAINLLPKSFNCTAPVATKIRSCSNGMRIFISDSNGSLLLSEAKK